MVLFESFLYYIIFFGIILFIVTALNISNITSDTSDNNFVASIVKSVKTGNPAGTVMNLLNQVGQKTANDAMGPSKSSIQQLNRSMSILNQDVEDGRNKVEKTEKSTFNIMSDMMNRIYNITGATQQMFNRIMFLMKRIVGVFITLIYAGRSGIAMGESFSNSVFGKILNFFCFAGDTRIKMKNGSYKNISNINIGDETEYDGIVTGIVKCKGINIPQYNMCGIIISGDHIVKTQIKIPIPHFLMSFTGGQKYYTVDSWIPAKYHKDSILLDRSMREEYLYNIETSKGTITLENNIKTKDYYDDGLISALIGEIADHFPNETYGKKKENDEECLMKYSYLRSTYNPNLKISITPEMIKTDYMYFNHKNGNVRWKYDKYVPQYFTEIDKILTHNLLLNLDEK
jgi:hypothetical protein